MLSMISMLSSSKDPSGRREEKKKEKDTIG
jgi:hypothetical protein